MGTNFYDDFNHLNSSTHGRKGIKAEFIFSRRLLSHILTIFLPTISLCLVSFCTSQFRVRLQCICFLFGYQRVFKFIIQPSHFNTALTMNVTTLLVLTTLFISTSNSLPTTSYVKMIDIWFIATFMMPFLEITVQTLISIMSNNEGKDDVHVFLTKALNEALQLRNERREAITKILQIIAQFVLPGFYILFSIIFFLIGSLTYEDMNI